MKSLDIAVVGGSIAGCSASILLRGAGHRVRVYERSRSKLVGRGGGLRTPEPLLESLKGEGLLPKDFPHLVATGMPFIAKSPDEPRFGHSSWVMPVADAAFQWESLWRALRSQVPDDSYLQGASVVGVAQDSADTARIEFADRSTTEADLVVFADGYRSLGRRILFPDVDLQYRGYMLWRGLLPERNLHDSATLESLVPRLSFPDQPGHFVAYLVPGEAGSTAPGERLVNWACYIALPQERLDSFMVDRSGHVRRGTIPPGELRADEEARLAAMMVRSLPAYYGEIVEASEQTYVQLIYTAQVPAYRSGRACLIGDAGSVAQPFTGSGVFKGYNNVSSLVRALASRESLDTALDAWSSEQTRVGNQVLKLGEQMEDAFIWNSLDLVEAGADEVERWFRDAISFPENATG